MRCSLAHTLCYKFGYGTDFERFKKEARDRFSLLSNGILNRPGCARLLLVNGTEDEIFPIDDYYLCLQYGDPKEVRCVNFLPTYCRKQPQFYFNLSSNMYACLETYFHETVSLAVTSIWASRPPFLLFSSGCLSCWRYPVMSTNFCRPYHSRRST